MKNPILAKDIKSFIQNKKNVLNIYKESINLKPSLTIDEKNPLSNTSYIYEEEEERDADLLELKKVLM
jgi:hypothetical protein